MKKLLLFLFAISLFLMISSTVQLSAANITSAATGVWSATTTWVGGVVPTSGDAVTIAAAHTVTMDANATINSLTVTGTLQFTNTTTAYALTFDAGSVITVNGTLNMGILGALITGTSGTTTLTMGAAGTLRTSNLTGAPVGALGPGAGASLQEQGTGVFNLSSLATSGTVNYSGVGTGAYTITDRNYFNLSMSPTTSTFTWTLAADRTIASTSNSAFSFGGGNLTLAGGFNILLAGGLTNNTVYAGTFNGGGSTIIFNGPITQYLSTNNNFPAGTVTWNNMNIAVNKPAGVALSGNGYNMIIDGTVTVNSGTFNTGTNIKGVTGSIINNGVINISATGFSLGGNFTNSGTATISQPLSLTGNFTNNLTFNSGANLITFNGTTPQTIGGTAANTTFGSMTINNLTGVTLNTNATVTTALNLTAGVFTLTNPLTLGNSATITRYGAGSFSGTPTFGALVNVSYANSVSNPTITPGTELPALSTVLNNLTVTGTTVNLSGDLTVNGGLTLAAGSILNSGGFNIVMKGNWTNNSSATAFNAGTGSVTWSGANASIAGTAATTFNNLTVNIPAINTLTLTTGPTVNGPFAWTSGLLSLGTGTLSVKSDFINNSSATLIGGSGTIQFNGTVPQALTGSFATSMPKLTLNNAAGLSLDFNTTVTTTLTLTSGVISTGVNSLFLSTGTATVARTSGYVVGTFTKAFATGTNVTKAFEIGTGTAYTPVSLTFASITAAGNLTANTFAIEHPDVANSGLDATKDVNRYWTIANSGLAFTNYSAAFTFVPSDIDAGANTSTFEVRKLDGTTWTYTTTGTRTATSTQATGLTSLSEFALGTVIPVTPAAPALVSPANSAVDLIVTPTLNWSSVYGATTYGVTVATDPGFTNIVIDQSGLVTPTYTVVTPLNNSTMYYWHATATNIAGTSIPSADWNFTTIIAIPPAPVLTAPTDAATEVSVTPLLTWDPAIGAATYRVQISSDPGFTTILIDQAAIATNSYTVVVPLGTSSLYYWRVNATNVGGTGPYSTTNSFNTTLTAPAVPTLLSPANLAINVSRQPTVSWNSVLGATSYSVEVATDAGFTNVVSSQTGITGTSYSISTLLAAGTVHYWHVSSTNIGGTSAYSGEWSFTTRAPATITSAANGNWNNAASWIGGLIPSIGDAVVINHTITMDASATIASLTINASRTLQFTNTTTAYTLTFDAGSVITVNGTLDMGILGALITGTSGTTTLTMGTAGMLRTSNLTGAPVGALGPGAGASLQEQGSGTFNLNSLATSGTVYYSGIGTGAYTVTDRNYNNLTVATTSSSFTWTLAADRTIAGTSASAFTFAAGSLTLAGGYNIFLAGGLNNTTVYAGTFNGGGSTIIFNGSAIQYISTNNNFPTGTVSWNNVNIIVNKPAGVALSGNGYPMSIGGSVTVNSGTFNASTNIKGVTGSFVNNATTTIGTAFFIGGNFTNNGTFTPGANVITFNGTTPQSISGTTGITFGSLTINNPTGVTLNQNVTVTTGLTLTNGAIITGANTLALSTATATVTRTNGFVNGNFRKPVAVGSNMTKLFELGTGTAYTPLSLTFSSITTAGSITAATVGTEHPNISTSGLNPLRDVNRYWTISNTGLVFTTYNAVFTFVPADIDAGSNPVSFLIKKYNAPDWSNVTTGTLTATSSQAIGLTSFGDFQIGQIACVDPLVVITDPAAVCSPATVNLTDPGIIAAGTTPGLDYTYWTDANATLSYDSYLTATSGIYYIKGTTVDGCFDIKPVTVTVNPLPASNSITGEAINCAGTMAVAYGVTTDNSATASYAWSYSGTGATLSATSGSAITIDLANDATSGDLTVVETTTLTGCSTVNTQAITINQCFKTLNLTSVLLEGLYNGGGLMRQAYDETGSPHWPAGVVDHISVELHDATNYAAILHTTLDVPLSTTGTASITIPATFNASYYITIKHRNSIETTTATAASFAGNTINQSFASPVDVYGGNLNVSPDTYYLIFGGDVNHDGIVDTGDMNGVDNGSTAITIGYDVNDINGDGIVDTGDMNIVDNNSTSIVTAKLPL